MTGDQYVESVLAKYQVQRGQMSAAEQLGTVVARPIRTWASRYLNGLHYTGSYAKETGVHGVSDVDVFISLRSDTPDSLKDIYSSLLSVANEQGWSPRQQSVSIGVTINGTRGDLVPGKLQAGYQSYHSLYLRKRDSWTQTNVSLHVETVRSSGRLREIRAVKIWRMLHGLDFPSLYLELFVVQALSGRSQHALADNVLVALQKIGLSLSSTRVMDPANTNNVLSDDLTMPEKERIARLASQSASQQYWKEIIW